MALESNHIENKIPENEEITIKEFILKIKEWIDFLLSKWKNIFLIVFIGGLIGLIIGLYEKPIYKGVLTFAMEEDKGGGISGGLSGALGLASSFGIDLGGANGGGAFAATNLSELMKSRMIVEKVLLEKMPNTDLTLIEYYLQFSKLREIFNKNPALKNIQFLPNSDRSKFNLLQDSVLQVVYKKLINPENLIIVQKDRKVSILSIEVSSENEVFSKMFCESIARETSELYIETKSKKSRMNVDVLQRQVDSVKNNLNIAMSSVANETDNVYNLNPSLLSKGVRSKRKQIDVQANTALLTNLSIQLELAKVVLRKETPLIQIIDRPIFPLEKNKFGKAKSILLGFFIAGLISVFYFTITKLYRNLIK